ncbi:YlbF family regulator [Streptococcus hongkongensis]|nr:hypothetical protein NC01_07040 [Streptococcus uberis]
MTHYQESLNQLIEAIENHSSIKDFKAISQNSQFLEKYKKDAYLMKFNQQNALLFNKFEKTNAAKQSEMEARKLQDSLENQLLIDDYRQKMQDASDLIQYVTKTIEEKINKEMKDDRT